MKPGDDAILIEPPIDCGACPRLVAFRSENQTLYPHWHNRPVPAFGSADAALLIVGLAPGRHGANRTGRPFTGDGAGLLLYHTLLSLGFARGRYDPDGADDLRLDKTLIVNAVRCLPPKNKPNGDEFRQCSRFLAPVLLNPCRRVVIALGGDAHKVIIRTYAKRLTDMPFGHGRAHRLSGSTILLDSYHCSRLNTNTGRLTAPMFEAIFMQARQHLAN